jgi:hypothetical protein
VAATARGGRWWAGAAAAFAAELASLAALAAWGATAPLPVAGRVALAAGWPLAAALLAAAVVAGRLLTARPAAG